MDGLKVIGAHAFNVGIAVAELAVAAYDFVTRRDPDAELRRFLAEHPNVTVYWTDGTS